MLKFCYSLWHSDDCGDVCVRCVYLKSNRLLSLSTACWMSQQLPPLSHTSRQNKQLSWPFSNLKASTLYICSTMLEEVYTQYSVDYSVCAQPVLVYCPEKWAFSWAISSLWLISGHVLNKTACSGHLTLLYLYAEPFCLEEGPLKLRLWAKQKK